MKSPYDSIFQLFYSVVLLFTVTATSILHGVIVCDNTVALTGRNAADAIRQEILVEVMV